MHLQFRFLDWNDTWLGPSSKSDHDDRKLMSAFQNYSDPFNCECRAFARLQEAGHEELALKCFGYVLLDEAHESVMKSQFAQYSMETSLCFSGDIYNYDQEELHRSLYLGKNGRVPPIRGIVKEFGKEEEEENLRPKLLRKILRDISKLQQLGILGFDVAARNIINGKFGDFSTAITVPHFLTTPELNPFLTPDMISAMELETFRLSLSDYLEFDMMIFEWNMEYADQKGEISVNALPGGRGCQIRYDLRSRTTSERVYTFVDPRKYDWRTCPADEGASAGIATNKGRSRRISSRQLSAKPPIWYYSCDGELAEVLRRPDPWDPVIKWDYKEGYIFPLMDR